MARQLHDDASGDARTAGAAPQAQPDLLSALRQRVEQQAGDLQAMYRQQEALAHGISHDLQASLRTIDGFAGLLARHPGATLDDTARGYLQRIRSGCTAMGGLVESLLALSHASRVELKSQSVDMSLLADWVGAELRDAEPDRIADIQVAPGLFAQGDERQMKLLLAQLLGNAWKFSRASARTQIRVDGELHDGRLQLRVHDQGAGFDMQYADKLFQPFQRLHGPEDGGGNGLGLAIAQCIVERHHGRLWAQSQVGAGSTFHVELPAPQEAVA